MGRQTVQTSEAAAAAVLLLKADTPQPLVQPQLPPQARKWALTGSSRACGLLAPLLSAAARLLPDGAASGLGGLPAGPPAGLAPLFLL